MPAEEPPKDEDIEDDEPEASPIAPPGESIEAARSRTLSERLPRVLELVEALRAQPDAPLVRERLRALCDSNVMQALASPTSPFNYRVYPAPDRQHATIFVKLSEEAVLAGWGSASSLGLARVEVIDYEEAKRRIALHESEARPPTKFTK